MTSLSAFHPEAVMALQSDHAGAQRDAALERVRVALEAAQHLVLGTHGMFNINLLDAKQGLETALADVEFERERAQ